MPDREDSVESRVAVLESAVECLLKLKEEFIEHTARHREDVLQLTKDLVTRAEFEKAMERLDSKVSNIPPWTAVVIGLMMAFLGALITIALGR